jgi:hypothetical protein
MFYEDNLKLYIKNVEDIESPEVQLISSKDMYGATYMLYMCHQNKTKYIILVQSGNILSYKAQEDQLQDIFPEHC